MIINKSMVIELPKTKLIDIFLLKQSKLPKKLQHNQACYLKFIPTDKLQPP